MRRPGLFETVAQDLASGLSSSEAKGEAERQCECADRGREQSIDQSRGDADLIHRYDDGKRPNRHAGNGSQQVRITQPSSTRRPAHEARQCARGEPSDNQDNEADHQIRKPEQKLSQDI